MRIVVVGGGIAGLVAAWRAQADGAEVILVEASSRLGGQIHTERVGGCVLEHGAEGFVARSASVPAVCGRVGLRDDLVSQHATRALCLDEGRLTELEPGEAGRRVGIQAHPSAWGHGLKSLRSGMGSLIASLAGDLSSSIRLHSTASRLMRVGGRGGGWRVDIETGELEADAVILALPPKGLVPLVMELIPDAKSFLNTVDTVSTVSVSLVMRTEDIVHPLDAAGFVVGGLDRMREFRACTFVSSKFEGRAAEGRSVLRAFFRPRGGDMRSPDYWIEQAIGHLAPVLGFRDSPIVRRAALWPSAIPRYRPGHDRSIARTREALRRLGFVELAGAAVTRSGVDGAVRSGLQAAERLVEVPSV